MSVLSAVAEFERDLPLERIAAGLTRAVSFGGFRDARRARTTSRKRWHWRGSLKSKPLPPSHAI